MSKPIILTFAAAWFLVLHPNLVSGSKIWNSSIVSNTSDGRSYIDNTNTEGLLYSERKLKVRRYESNERDEVMW